MQDLFIFLTILHLKILIESFYNVIGINLQTPFKYSGYIYIYIILWLFQQVIFFFSNLFCGILKIYCSRLVKIQSLGGETGLTSTEQTPRRCCIDAPRSHGLLSILPTRSEVVHKQIYVIIYLSVFMFFFVISDI